MAEATTTQVTPTPNNGTGTSAQAPQNSSTKAPTSKNNNVQRDGDHKSPRSPRQNYNNRPNNNPPAGGGAGGGGGGFNDKNPRRGKRYTRKTNNESGGSVKASSQGEDPVPATVNAGNSREPGLSSSANQSAKPANSVAPSSGVQKSWSNVVAAPYNQPPPIQHNGTEAQGHGQVKPDSGNQGQGSNNQNHEGNNSKRQNRAKKSGNKFEEKKSKPEEPENFNPDEKIEAIQIQLDKTLNSVKQLQEQIKAIKVERDGKIDELNTERANLVEELQKFKFEYTDTENQITNLEATITQLKSNRKQKVRSLVDHSRALLNDKAI